MKTYDYIVVGAGSSGAVLAAQLSAVASNRVLLLEAGGANQSPLVKMPKGIAKLVSKPAYHWNYQVNQKRNNGQGSDEVWIRGKGLGGSSAINGMIWSRGHMEDYDAWEKMGCKGWNWQTMNSAIKALENHQLGAAENRGEGGPVTISSGTDYYPLIEHMLKAGEEMGLARVVDLNDTHAERVGLYSHNIKSGRRVSSAHAYLNPARKRENIDVVTGANVHRILFDGLRAIGVDVCIDGQHQEFYCKHEIILSSGTMESPRLLQLSGIGPKQVLDKAGVPIVFESPDVGRRMREHLAFALSYRLKRQLGNQKCFMGLGLLSSVLNYQLFGKGAMATGPFEVGAFAHLGDKSVSPNLQLYLSGYVFKLSEDNHPVPISQVDPLPGLSIYGQLLQLKSEGELAIVSSDANEPMDITPNWLTHPEDRELAVASVRYMRQYVNQPALKPLLEEELVPGNQCQTDEEILQEFYRLATCGLHATGSCRMGSDEASVVDPQLRVRGVTGLRVADCSVMPGLISGNTNAPAMGLGYRAAQLILGQA